MLERQPGDNPQGERGASMNLMLIDDHAVVRTGLRLLLEQQPQMRVCGEATSVPEALGLTCEPDAILLDLVLGNDLSGPGAVAAIRENFPGVPVLVLSMVDSLPMIDTVFAAGARGYILKDAAADELVEAIRAVAAGKEYLQPSLGAALVRWKARLPVPAGGTAADLTQRERQILRLVALGHTNSEIAEILAIAVRTVETHRAHLVQKTGAQTRAQLVRLAQEAQLDLPPSPKG
ncbi:MAG: response regulator transcription factor [Nocardiopsaceae bacterium]|jgi:two-component system response regulator NreC|nr:response regulator transcription factor [Nocardiopsaceae bacterium]